MESRRLKHMARDRSVTTRYSYPIIILTQHIGSIHFAPLAGRLLLKDVRYHSSNQTVKIVKTQITWRYWIRRITTEEDLNNARVGGEGRMSFSTLFQLF